MTNATAHPLDDMIWETLTGPHASLALRQGNAARYPDGMPLFAALGSDDPAALADLAWLLEPGGLVALASPMAFEPGSEWTQLSEIRLVQMVCEVPVKRPDAAPVVLGERDVPDMLALVELTQPGPFGPRSIELGRYVGYRGEAGDLVAMAGERLCPPGYTEVSAVCTHPVHRRRGLGEAVLRDVASAIQARGQTPMLHVEAESAALLDFYTRLGFRARRDVVLTIVQKSER